jgi:hypothetical protein
MKPKHFRPSAITLAVLTVLPSSAQVFNVDFSSFSGPDCVKNKIGVYQTPFMGTAGLPPLTSMAPFLIDAGVSDLRYEMGWGKPDAFAYDQIAGTSTNLAIDFTRLDPFVQMLQTNGITPLFAVGYDPVPLKTCSTWQCWKDVPDDLSAWREILKQYAAHYAGDLGLRGIHYEIWNEPDLPGDGGKVFFNGNQSDYGNIYSNGMSGIYAGASDAQVGGPTIAYDTTYLTQSGILKLPMNFASIHAYGNPSGQISGLLTALGGKNAPVFLTEFGSFSTSTPNSPWNYHAGAAFFFNDVKDFLNYPENVLSKVYWAQWIDDGIGMITYSLHKKAIYNAYKIYQTMLPLNRNAVSPDSFAGVNTLAASGNYNAGVVVWNTNKSEANVAINLNHLPLANGTLELYRIDGTNASYYDNSSTENLAVNSQWNYTGSTSDWTGSVPAQSVVFIVTTPFPPSVPTGGKAVADYGQVALSWNASSGAISYYLRRSTTVGGPYSIIARTTQTNYTDSRVASGSSYYYVVAAINSLGNSANSMPATASVPSVAGKLVVWFHADEITGLNNGTPLATWMDDSGFGNNASQANASHQPIYLTNGINGLPAVHFDNGNDDYMSFNRAVQDDFTIICVFESKQGAGTGTQFWQGAGLVNGEMPNATNDFGAALNTNGQVLAGIGNPDTTLASSSEFNDGNPHVFTFKRVRATGMIALFVDGILVNEGIAGTQSLTSPPRLVLGAQQTLLNYFTGDIAEVKIYDVALTDDDRQHQETGLRYKYAINNLTPPNLSLSFIDDNLIFTWPVYASGFKLESTSYLTPAVLWSEITNAVQTNDGLLNLTLPTSKSAEQFFRLRAN